MSDVEHWKTDAVFEVRHREGIRQLTVARGGDGRGQTYGEGPKTLTLGATISYSPIA